MIKRLVGILVFMSMLLVGSAVAQGVHFAATFETMDGEPAVVREYASGDHLVLRVEVRNESDAVLTPDDVWVGFAPVEGATLHSSTVGGFSSLTACWMKRGTTSALPCTGTRSSTSCPWLCHRAR